MNEIAQFGRACVDTGAVLIVAAFVMAYLRGRVREGNR